MASREEKSALENLQRLVDSDLTVSDHETLAAAVRSAELALDKAPEWSGRFIAELKSRMPWSDVTDLVGLPQTTLYRRAKPFLPDDDVA